MTAFAFPAGAAVSKTSKRIIRLGAVPAGSSDFSAVTLSTFSILWGWSTGTFTDPGITKYRLYTGTPTVPDYQELAPGTTWFLDTGLGANKMITRWLAVSSGAEVGSDSPHFEKYTHALPPASFLLSTVTATSAYLEWTWSAATAYAIEGSTNAGVSYYRIRDSFVPWQTVELLSNKNYRIRMGAINGDNELTPAQYSTEKTTTTPPLNPSFEPAVAISSYSIQWRWSTGTFTGTEITGYRLYRSSTTADAAIPTDGLAGVVVADLADITLSSWTETFIDSGTVASANSRHTRWLKAYGILESTGRPIYQKYTYAIAPATCSAFYLDPYPYYVYHVSESSLDSLIWNSGLDPVLRNGIASSYVVEYSTVGDFTVPIGTSSAGASPAYINGLTSNTKYDVRLGAVNGDEEQTPDDPQNQYAYSDYYKFMTRPARPSDFAGRPLTDTALAFTWSTAAYANPEYITGYTIAKSTFNESLQQWVLVAVAFMPGVSSGEYSLDYLMTNSTHTRYVGASQADPDCGLAPNFWCYDSGASSFISADGATFATPPNDVSFSTVGARNVWVWWNEPEVPATKYRVERSTTLGSQGPWVFLSSTTGALYEDTGLTPLTTYSYRIGAINLLGVQTIGISTATGGNRRDYSFVSSTITRHMAPILSGVAASSVAITWTWTDPSPGVTVTSYVLYTASGGVIAAGISASTTQWVEGGLSGPNTQYTRLLRSVADSGGVGDFTTKDIYTLANPPAAGTVVVTSSGMHALAIGWPADASSWYKVDRSPDGLAWTNLRSLVNASSATAYSDSGLHYSTTYYYAVSGYNYDGIVSVSSAVTSGADMTLPLPVMYTGVFSTAAASQLSTAALAGVGTLAVTIPAGAPDGYFYISTSAATSPTEVSKTNLDAATANLHGVELLTGSIMELRYYDAFGTRVTSNLPSPARITITYIDGDDDGVVDGTSLGETSLRLFNLDTTALVWNRLSNSMLDPAARTVYADLPHFSIYALGSLTSVTGALADVFAYPNPYRPGSGGNFDSTVFGEGIVFESLPARSKIKIYSLAGALVAEVSDDDGDGRCLWNARNKDGSRAASGVYLYVVSSDAGKKKGRIAIIR
ncbi:MAG: hypothetical protein A2016_09360 [Elusimicrobia bacterium GWF2_62_30]|nr:MAG: hypothetical protein A2016_09360 [Elusimicrobia bacterium GWF2_62_30]